MQVRNFDPALGQAFQGDIAIISMPKTIKIATTDEVKPRDGRLIIQEGEATGHHHAIAVPRVRRFRDDTRQPGDPGTATRDTRLLKKFGGGHSKVAVSTSEAKVVGYADTPDPEGFSSSLVPIIETKTKTKMVPANGIARLYRDGAAIEALRQTGLITRTDLAIGCLVVEDEPVVVTHDEHDGIRLSAGNYYVGRQIESAGAEERVVGD